VVALAYLLFLLVLPVGLVLWRTFGHGLGPFIGSLSTPEALHAFRVTVVVALWAVAADTVFGVGTAGLRVRHRFPGRRVLAALGYGVVLCLARALGEYGAVAVVSGRLVGQTQTMTLFVEERFGNFDQPAAFAAATALALVAVVTLLATHLLRPKG